MGGGGGGDGAGFGRGKNKSRQGEGQRRGVGGGGGGLFIGRGGAQHKGTNATFNTACDSSFLEGLEDSVDCLCSTLQQSILYNIQWCVPVYSHSTKN